MLQLQVLRDETARVLEGLAKRNFKDAEELVFKALELDKNKRSIQTDTQERESKANAQSKKIGEFMKSGKADEVASLRSLVAVKNR